MSDSLPAGWQKSTSYSLQHESTGWKIALTKSAGVLSFDLWCPPKDEGSRLPWSCHGHFPTLEEATVHHDELTGGSDESC